MDCLAFDINFLLPCPCFLLNRSVFGLTLAELMCINLPDRPFVSSHILNFLVIGLSLLEGKWHRKLIVC